RQPHPEHLRAEGGAGERPAAEHGDPHLPQRVPVLDLQARGVPEEPGVLARVSALPPLLRGSGGRTEEGMANFGIVGVDWQQRINWDRLRRYRLERARERMKAHGLGALLLMYDENVRYVTSTLTPGWNRLKPGLRYALLCGDGPPVLFEQGDIGMHIEKHSPWIPKDNIRYSYAWIKGAAGPASTQQVGKFTNAIKQEMKKRGVDGLKLGVDFIDINMIRIFQENKIEWGDGMTAMMEARAVKNQDEHECMRVVGAIGDAAHWEFMKFLKPGLTENQLTAHIMEYLYSIPG